MTEAVALHRSDVIITEERQATEDFHLFLEDLVNGVNPSLLTVATVPAAADNTGKMLFISDETGGATMAFSDGTDWRRVQDRAIIS